MSSSRTFIRHSPVRTVSPFPRLSVLCCSKAPVSPETKTYFTLHHQHNSKRRHIASVTWVIGSTTRPDNISQITLWVSQLLLSKNSGHLLGTGKEITRLTKHKLTKQGYWQYKQFLCMRFKVLTVNLKISLSNTDEPIRCNNDLLIYKIISTCFGQYFSHHQERETEIFTAYGNYTLEFNHIHLAYKHQYLNITLHIRQSL
jgi:hypothetical protein